MGMGMGFVGTGMGFVVRQRLRDSSRSGFDAPPAVVAICLFAYGLNQSRKEIEMDPALYQRPLLLYSKFSVASKAALEMAAKVQEVRPICVDDKRIRSLILRDKRLGVRLVPTILVVRDGGIVEKYEGARASAFLLARAPTPEQPTATNLERPPKPTRVSAQHDAPVAASEAARTVLPEMAVTDLLDLDSGSDGTGDDQTPEETSEGETGGGRNTTAGLPIKKDSGIGAKAAELMKERESTQGSMPARPGMGAPR